MDYNKYYQRLITLAKQRAKVEGYSERHHIVPRYAGGSDESANLVRLTAREHYVAHLLLAKHSRDPRAWAAVFMMGGKGRTSSRMYAAAKLGALPMMIQNGKKVKVLYPDMARKNGVGMEARKKSDPKLAARQKEWCRIGGQVTGARIRQELTTNQKYRDAHSESSRLGGIAAGKIIREDPVKSVRLANHARSLAMRNNTSKIECIECGMVTNVGCLSYHQKVSGHLGSRILE